MQAIRRRHENVELQATITQPANFDSFYATETVSIAGIVWIQKYDPDEVAITWGTSIDSQSTQAQTVPYHHEASGRNNSWDSEIEAGCSLDAQNDDGFTAFEENLAVVTDVNDEDLDGDGFSPGVKMAHGSDPSVYQEHRICGDNIMTATTSPTIKTMTPMTTSMKPASLPGAAW